MSFEFLLFWVLWKPRVYSIAKVGFVSSSPGSDGMNEQCGQQRGQRGQRGRLGGLWTAVE